MTCSNWNLLVSAAALILAAASPARADWTKDQRSLFVGSCVEGCQSTPGACLKLCNCVADHGEGVMSAADLDELVKARAENKMMSKMEALTKFLSACTKRQAVPMRKPRV